MSEVCSCDVRHCMLQIGCYKSSEKLIAVGFHVGCALLTFVGWGKSAAALNLSTYLSESLIIEIKSHW